MKAPKSTIKNWATEDRPREKLQQIGKNNLTDTELLAILINSGTKEDSALELAKKILASANNNLNELARFSLKQLMQFKGIGEARAISIAAALELGKRRKSTEHSKKAKITSSQESFEIWQPILCDLDHEEFWIMLLNRNNEVIKTIQISIGGIANILVDMRIVFKHCLENLASGLILAHNHPSGNLKASKADIDLTKRIKQVAEIMGIELLDHLIIAHEKYYSFQDNDLI